MKVWIKFLFLKRRQASEQWIVDDCNERKKIRPNHGIGMGKVGWETTVNIMVGKGFFENFKGQQLWKAFIRKSILHVVDCDQAGASAVTLGDTCCSHEKKKLARKICPSWQHPPQSSCRWPTACKSRADQPGELTHRIVNRIGVLLSH